MIKWGNNITKADYKMLKIRNKPLIHAFIVEMCMEVQGEASVSGSKACRLDVVRFSQCWEVSFFLLFFLLCHRLFLCISTVLMFSSCYPVFLLCIVMSFLPLSLHLSSFISFFPYFQSIHPPLLLSFLLHGYHLCWIFFCLSLRATSPSVFVSSFHHLIPIFFPHCLHCFDLS